MVTKQDIKVIIAKEGLRRKMGAHNKHSAEYKELLAKYRELVNR